MNRARSKWRMIAAFIPFALGVVAATFSCAAPPDDVRITELKAGLDLGHFKDGVSNFLEKRCGTLDCHGQPGRPLRIYGQNGLRLPNDGGITPASNVGTTDPEIAANYRSVLGLEPEQMNRVALGGVDPLALLILLKPLGYEPDDPSAAAGVRHRGGPQIVKDGDGYKCLYDWLRNSYQEATKIACQKGANGLILRP